MPSHAKGEQLPCGFVAAQEEQPLQNRSLAQRLFSVAVSNAGASRAGSCSTGMRSGPWQV